MENNNSNTQQSGAYIKALIKIAHPDWTPEQIEAEYLKKLEELNNPENSDGCDFCSG